MIKRKAIKLLNDSMFKGKVIYIPGARQVGKTTMLRQLGISPDDVLNYNGDEPDTRELLSNINTTRLKTEFGNKKVIVIDEAQRITNIGLTLKLIVDNFPDKQVIALGSSAIEMANTINEPLTGRKTEINLFPISFSEMVTNHGLQNERRLLEHRLIYGYYPEVVTSPGNEINILKRLSDAYLYKDIFTLENIKKPLIVEKLLQALAFQVGSEVSAHELGQTVGADNKTIERYIDLLQKAFIIFQLSSLSRNLRNELKKSRKIYFFDNGIRNALIRNFNPISLRQDVGALWENFIISERIKATEEHGLWVNRYFWRNHNQQEIDYIEEYAGKTHAYEMKWNKNKSYKFPGTFMEAYPEHTTLLVTPDNYLDFLMIK